MFVPHVLAVLAIVSGRPLLAGLLAGGALLCNSKGLLVLAVLLVWDWRNGFRTLAGFALVQASSLVILPVGAYWQQVWWWGARYSADTFVQQPVREFLYRSSGWAAFHATAVIGPFVFLVRSRDWRMAFWLVVSFAGVAAGLRFFPRYYFQLLPVAALAGARGLLLLQANARLAALALLLIPVVRFGPRYAALAVHGTAGWADTAMMEDSRQVSRMLPAGQVLVWGYRPDVFVFSGRKAATPFLDSQPLTGVLADRHLFSSRPTLPELALMNRQELTRSRPEYIVDGLGPLNPVLAISRYPELKEWLRSYEEVARTTMSVVLRRRPDGLSPPEER
jgi:hypothetical protein